MRTFVTDQIKQTPDEFRPAQVNWDIQLPPLVTITTSEFITDSDDYVISLEGKLPRATIFWLKGGIAGRIYYITNRCLCSDGEVVEATIPFRCQAYNLIQPACA